MKTGGKKKSGAGMSKQTKRPSVYLCRLVGYKTDLKFGRMSYLRRVPSVTRRGIAAHFAARKGKAVTK